MIGLPSSHMSRNNRASSPRPSWRAAYPAPSAMPDRSAPAQKALSPAPVSTTTRTSGSALAAAKCWRSSVMTVHESELRFSGRSMVRWATCPSTS